MHDDAIHDSALAYWSGLLPPIKRHSNQNETGETGKLLVSILSSICVPKILEFIRRNEEH